MRLGIIGAMDVEVDILKDRMANLSTTLRAGMRFYEGELEGIPVVVVVCGVGKVNAAICTQVLCTSFGVSHIINTGIAGSLRNNLDIGDIVVSTDAMHHDFDCTAFGYYECMIPKMPLSFTADTYLIDCVTQAAEKVHPGHVCLGRIASGDQFVADPLVKQSIIRKTKAYCTEMEGVAIAQSAYCNGVPFVILRTISDKADSSAEVDYPTFEAQAAERGALVVMTLARQLNLSYIASKKGGHEGEVT